ncbi:MAG: hypothetical protein KC766_39640, partial [Myxococcales bacterium]|nr:hypothetical protein [Myxococcales bacterium]
AFAWEVCSYASERAAIALLLPAMTLSSEGSAFRKAFFSGTNVVAVANFRNLRRVLFAGRAEHAAAAIFYRGPGYEHEHDVLVYSPLVANQEANRPVSEGKRTQTWAIALNRSEIRALPQTEAARGLGLSWTMAMWGSARDRRLFDSVRRRFPTLGDFATKLGLHVNQGLELRRQADREPVEQLDEVIGQDELKTERLRNIGRIHAFAEPFFDPVPPERGFVRKGRGAAAEVCRPPHVIVSAARTFAVFSDAYVVVPPRQIGIAGDSKHADTLRALALYLSSDFAAYHQFFSSPQAETRGRYTLAALRRLPIPLAALDEETLGRWVELQQALEATSPVEQWLVAEPAEFRQDSAEQRELEDRLNALVGDALGLSESERWLVHDFVHVRRSLADGLVREPATGRPSQQCMVAFADALRHELDAFLDPGLSLEHRVVVGGDAATGVAHVSLGGTGEGASVLLNSGRDLDEALGSVRDRVNSHSQWLYFDRNLFVHKEDATFIMKPMQRMWWTRSQALLDADELIAQVLTPESV